MTLGAIKPAIEELAEQERTAFIDWLLRRDREEWDRQMAADLSSGGREGRLLDEVDAAIDRGDFKLLR